MRLHKIRDVSLSNQGSLNPSLSPRDSFCLYFLTVLNHLIPQKLRSRSFLKTTHKFVAGHRNLDASNVFFRSIRGVSYHDGYTNQGLKAGLYELHFKKMFEVGLWIPSRERSHSP